MSETGSSSARPGRAFRIEASRHATNSNAATLGGVRGAPISKAARCNNGNANPATLMTTR